MKHIKLFKDPSLYDDFFNQEEIITPHIVVLKNADNTPAKIKLQKYIPPVLPEGPANPLLTETVLKTDDLGNTMELGVTVYNYLKYKCGNGTVNASYTIPENEYLYCVYDSAPSPTITNETTVRVRYAVFDSYTIYDNVYYEINLYENNITPAKDESGEPTYRLTLNADGRLYHNVDY